MLNERSRHRLRGPPAGAASASTRSRARRPRDATAPGDDHRVLGARHRELLGVQLARCDDEVVDGLVGLEPEHDRGVAELEAR